MEWIVQPSNRTGQLQQPQYALLKFHDVCNTDINKVQWNIPCFPALGHSYTEIKHLYRAR